MNLLKHKQACDLVKIAKLSVFKHLQRPLFAARWNLSCSELAFLRNEYWNRNHWSTNRSYYYFMMRWKGSGPLSQASRTGSSHLTLSKPEWFAPRRRCWWTQVGRNSQPVLLSFTFKPRGRSPVRNQDLHSFYPATQISEGFYRRI